MNRKNHFHIPFQNMINCIHHFLYQLMINFPIINLMIGNLIHLMNHIIYHINYQSSSCFAYLAAIFTLKNLNLNFFLILYNFFFL